MIRSALKILRKEGCCGSITAMVPVPKKPPKPIKRYVGVPCLGIFIPAIESRSVQTPAILFRAFPGKILRRATCWSIRTMLRTRVLEEPVSPLITSEKKLPIPQKVLLGRKEKT